MSHAELYKTEPDPQSGFTAQSVRAMQEEEEEEEGVMEGGRTDGWGEWWQLLKEETLRLPGTRLVLRLQTQTQTHTHFLTSPRLTPVFQPAPAALPPAGGQSVGGAADLPSFHSHNALFFLR